MEDDMLAHREILRSYAAQCAKIRNNAADDIKRELFGRLAEQLDGLASEIERVITASVNVGKVH